MTVGPDDCSGNTKQGCLYLITVKDQSYSLVLSNSLNDLVFMSVMQNFNHLVFGLEAPGHSFAQLG